MSIYTIRGGGVARVPLDGYIATGYISDSTNSWFKMMLLRFDDNGDTLWTRTYNDTTDLEGEYIKIARNHRYIICSMRADYNIATYQYRPVLTETDSSGNRLWQKTYYRASHLYSFPEGIDTCADGGFIFSSTGYDSTYECGYQIIITKVDSVGNTQWTKIISNGYCNAGAGRIVSLRHGGYIVCGYQDTKNPSTYPYWPYTFPELWLAKFNNTGNMLWQKYYNQSHGQGQYLATPIELSNGNLIVCGGDSSTGGDVGCILKTDSNGNQLWLRNYINSSVNIDFFLDIRPTPDAGYISCGYTYGSHEFTWVVKTDSLGCADSAGCNYLGLPQIKIQNGEIKIEPNPNNGVFTVDFRAEKESGETVIEIYNMMGERIYHSFLPHPDSYRDTKGALKQINLSGQPNGIYLYRVVTTDGKLVGDGKFVIEK